MRPGQTILTALGALGGVIVLSALFAEASKPTPPPLPPAPPPGPAPAPPTPPAPGPIPNRPAPAPVPAPPHEITGNLNAVPGRLYRATVNLRPPISWVANTDKVHSQAVSQGFTDVVVQSGRKPPGWPGRQDGDYYVTGVYSGAPKTMADSYAGGEVKIIEVWEG
jgi:hypothetical protein